MLASERSVMPVAIPRRATDDRMSGPRLDMSGVHRAALRRP
jgi:hypothetical protein